MQTLYKHNAQKALMVMQNIEKVFSLKQNMHNVILKNDKTMMG